MKKVLQLILIIFTSLHVTGSLALATSFITPIPEQKGAHVTHLPSFHRKIAPVNLPNQLLKTESEEEDAPVLPVAFFSFWHRFYDFAPASKVGNKHFLIHYATFIKCKLPALFVLHQVFLL